LTKLSGSSSEQQQTARERAVLAGEMQAAQQIQQMLIEPGLKTMSGLCIEVAFVPMQEVGGDFYTCHILQTGRQRILLGDVSGKGAAAERRARQFRR
jgi:serine phosphatase RsbU (regulator of sigma subunit)